MIKQLLLTLLFFFGLGTLLPAQLILDQADVPVIGDFFTLHRDSNSTGVVITPPSAVAQTWDFGDLKFNSSSSRDYIDPATTPEATLFPNANLAVDVNGLISYIEQTPTTLSIVGLAGDPFGVGLNLSAPFIPSQQIYEIPSTYGTTFNKTYGLTSSIDGSAFMVDSVRVRRVGTINSEMDAFGMITTPTGTYEAIREHKIETTLDSIWVQFFGFETLFQTLTDTIETYSWIAKETKGPIVTVTVEDGELVRTTYTLAPATDAPIADFSYENEEGGTIEFKDESNNVPDTWLWDFGDGNTSTLQNPTHTYMEDGSYTVCLTVTNVFGTNMTCEMINVVVAAAPIADFEVMVMSSGANIAANFTDLSQNDPTAWLWDFGDGGISTSQNPTYVYAMPGTYQVCLTASNAIGSNESCKNVNIILPPVADFSIIDMSNGSYSFTDLSSNTPTTWLWDFGDGNGSTLQNPSYIYANLGTYEVCLTATNAGGSNTSCKEIIYNLTATENIFSVIDVRLFPNPTSDIVQFEITNLPRSQVTLFITDILGRRLCQHILNDKQQQSINVTSWTKGIYFYHLSMPNGTIINSGNLVVN